MHASAADHDHASDVDAISRDFEHSIRLNEDMNTQKRNFEEEELYHDAEEDTGEQETGEQETGETTGDEEEFSFTFNGEKGSPIAAEDAFVNGKIKPMFPLFNQDLLKQEQYFRENLVENPKVKKVLFKDSSHNDEISGPYCEWKGKADADKERWKKSNSTGFSKLWRLKELVNRSNSDGRDAFVFLNNSSSSSSLSSNNQNVEAKGGNGKEKVIKGGKKKAGSFSAHETYMKNKAKETENDRRKSYMPYKPEVFGFFTNVNGGISKNVHPY